MLSFSSARRTAPNERQPLLPSSDTGVLNKSPTASSRNGRSLAYADASQSPFSVRRPLSFSLWKQWLVDFADIFNTSSGSFLVFLTCQALLHVV